MPQKNPNAIAVRETVERYIENASRFNVNEIDRIYHNDLKIVEIDESGNVVSLDRTDVMAFFRSKQSSGAKPLSTQAEFNYVEATENTGHVVVTRKMQPREQLVKSVVSMHLVWEDDRWQLTRQMVFVKPLE